MSSTLYGSRWVGDTDPGSTTAGFDWYDTTTGLLKVRNSSNTAWITVGAIDQTNLGLLPLTGGTMTGAILGATGWAPSTSPDFATSAKLGGLDLATQQYVQTQITALQTTISTQVTEALAAATSGLSVSANIAFKSGWHYDSYANMSSTGFTIALPTYPSGATSQASEVKGYGAAIVSIAVEDNTVSARKRYLYMKESAANSRNFIVIYISDDGSGAPAWTGAPTVPSSSGDGTTGHIGIAWWILAAR